MEDFFSLVFFVIVAIVSIVSKIKKSGGGSDSAVDSSLSEAISAMKREISNSRTTASAESSSYSYDHNSSYDTVESYDTQESYDSGRSYDSMPSYEEQVEVVTKNLLSEGSQDSPAYEKKVLDRNIIRKRLRELTVWKEVLDKPVSMR